MDKQPRVVFRNVGQVYFPQTRVECHYSLTSDHQWSNSDWIGIFEMGWTSVKQYYTYTWATVPEGYTEGTSVDFCAVFQASYLPRPSTVEYQFVYVDKMREVCARSLPFTFCAPKPLEELETLKEEEDAEDGEEELLLVIPRAQLLQSRLEECLKKQGGLQQALDVAKKETENEKENSRKARSEWEYEREAMKEEIMELRDNLIHSREMLKTIEDAKYSQESLASELSKLAAEKAEREQRIKDLEEDIEILAEREKEQNRELERLKERVKKMSCQMKHDEEKRKSLQMENEDALAEARLLQERLEASDHVAESLRRELRDLSTRQGHTHTDLHQARLQVAQLTLQLSEENLLLREERANWALEREAYRHAAETDKKKLQDLACEVQKKEEWLQEERMEREKLEVQLGREKDYNKVLLGEAKRELQELRASLRKVQKEREEEQLQNQDLVNYIHQLEQRLGIVSEAEASSTAPACVLLVQTAPGSTPASDESASSASSRSVCAPASPSNDLQEPDRAEIPPETRIQSEEEDTPASDTQDEEKEQCEPSAAERKKLILPELINPVLSELADSPMW
ncbi:calcium-binding and coiled-coil domain-containing protein 1b [Oreochromis aureus]|uniref:calcium-binding and coiled-coil domain-containing protein 1b n=1 Tax=Oreochromis aureus TaxID=47969 RepID=UPI0012BD3885|nr:calcium-binding and coiled-coil domain-containing protein 1b [Oreochromis aureus]